MNVSDFVPYLAIMSTYCASFPCLYTTQFSDWVNESPDRNIAREGIMFKAAFS